MFETRSISKIAGISDKLGLADADAKFDTSFPNSLHMIIEEHKLQFAILSHNFAYKRKQLSQKIESNYFRENAEMNLLAELS